MTGLREVDHWLNPFRRFWTQRLDALPNSPGENAPASSAT